MIRDKGLACIKLLSISADLLTVATVFVMLVLLRKAGGGEFFLRDYFELWPFLVVFWLVFELLGLYSGTSIYSGSSLGPVEEIRRIVYAVSAIFMALGFSNYCYRPNDYLYSRAILAGTWVLCLILLPVNRFFLRTLLARLNCRRVPAILIGSGETARKIFENMQKHPEYGLSPVGFFTDSPQSSMPPEAVFLGGLEDISSKSAELAVKYAILAKDDTPDSPHIQQLINRYGCLFPHLLIVPKAFLNTCACVTPKDLSGMLGLEVRHNLQIPSIYRLKRVIDFACTIPFLTLLLPLMGILALWVRIDSPGPVIFKHRRIAGNGRSMEIYKFRTMVNGAEKQLEELLSACPTMKSDWELYGKIENDPRITRAGKWLRKTSLDELPQLFNVLQGRLTLVGPRPIIQQEVAIYGESSGLFDRVLPGVTGLWQVSGRNGLSYQERVRLDLYYVNNWSVWLDLYILSKTVSAVLCRNGAR